MSLLFKYKYEQVIGFYPQNTYLLNYVFCNFTFIFFLILIPQPEIEPNKMQKIITILMNQAIGSMLPYDKISAASIVSNNMR